MSLGRGARSRLGLSLVLALGLLVAAGGLARGAPAEGEAAEGAGPTPTGVQERAEEVAEALRKAEARLEEVGTDGAGASPTTPTTGPDAVDFEERLRDLRRAEVQELERLEVLLQQLGTALTTREEVRRDLAAMEAAIEAARREGPDEEGPYSFVYLDGLVDELVGQETRREGARVGRQVAREALESARDELDAAEAALRRVREMASAETARSRVLAQARVRGAEIDVRRRRTLVELREVRLELQELRLERIEAEMALLRAKRDWVKARLEVRKEDLEEVVERLEGERNALQATMEEDRRALQETRRSLEELRGEGRARDAESPRARGLRAKVRRLRTQLTQASREEEWLLEAETLWRRRFALLEETPGAEEIGAWLEESEQALAQLQRERRYLFTELSELRKDIVDVEQELESAAEDGGGWWVTFRRRQLEELLGATLEHLQELEDFQRQHQKLRDSLQARVGGLLDLGWWRALSGNLLAAWRFEIVAVDGRSVTVGKLVIALILVVLGYLAAGRVSERARRWLEGRFQLGPGAGGAVETLLFYGLLALFTLMALQVAAVPLTVFTFIGGALAIGVGFGSQNLLNNFISGLILLMERPIRVGDSVEVGGTFGRVTQVGARCTRVRTPDNIEVLVPNSTLLESNVVNWTLSDRNIRATLNFGVAYGTDPEAVKELLLEAAKEHEKVRPYPAAKVWFQDFGDSSLDFRLMVWVDMDSDVSRFEVLSDLRFHIERLCRERGITIPFPQRDVNLQGVGPVDVRLVDGDRRGAGAEPAAEGQEATGEGPG